MRLTATIALMIAVLTGVMASSNAETKPMYGDIYGRVYSDGNVVSKAFVEFVIIGENGEEFNAQALTDDHGVYRIEGAPYGRGYGKVTTPDSRGPATEFVEVNQPHLKVIFKL